MTRKCEIIVFWLLSGMILETTYVMVDRILTTGYNAQICETKASTVDRRFFTVTPFITAIVRTEKLP